MALGRSSLVIAIPKYWLEKSNLKRGDVVSLNVQNDGSLSVHPGIGVEKERKITLHVVAEESGNSIIRRVISCYLNGFTTIHLRSNKIFTQEQQSAIRDVVKTLYMRIMESHTSETTLQTLMDESMGSVFSGIERMHIITSSMCQDVLKAMKSWDGELARSVLSLEEDVDQFMYFLLRLIRRAALNSSLAHQLGLGMLDCLDCQTLVHRIEHVADHTTSIADNLNTLIEGQSDVLEGVLTVLVEAAEIAFNSYDMAVRSFLSKSSKDVNRIIDDQEEIEELGGLITPLPYSGDHDEKANICPLCAIRESIKRISEYSADIAEITIDRTHKD